MILSGLAINQEARPHRVLVRSLRTLAVALFSHKKQKPNMDSFPAQPLGGSNLNGNDPLGIARPPSIHTQRIFGGRNKRRHRIHVRRKHGCRMRMFRMAREHVEAIALDRRFLHLVAQPA